MGITTVSVRISNPADRTRALDAPMLVDSGAIFSVVPADELHALGIGPEKMDRFSLADGRIVTRPVGIARFEVAGQTGGAPVVFGEPDDAWLLGALTLESLGLMLDPFKRELRPIRLLLYGMAPADPVRP